VAKQAAKMQIPNPTALIQFWILDFGFWIVKYSDECEWLAPNPSAISASGQKGGDK
jgi:hypothetical protein